MTDQLAPVRSLAHQRNREWRPIERSSSRPDRRAYLQGSLALSYPMASGLPVEPRSRALIVVNDRSAELADIPPAEEWAARFLQAVVEVVTSDRPLTQLARWTNSSVFDEIMRRQRFTSAQRKASPARTTRLQVATVRVCHVTTEIAEVAARVRSGHRSRAVATRLEFDRGRWRCTAIEFG